MGQAATVVSCHVHTGVAFEQHTHTQPPQKGFQIIQPRVDTGDVCKGLFGGGGAQALRGDPLCSSATQLQ
jgi:hypothetical protein